MKNKFQAKNKPKALACKCKSRLVNIQERGDCLQPLA